MPSFQSLPGFREFYPEEFARRSFIFNHWRRAARVFGFAEFDAPVLEPLELYQAKSGEEIEQQLFSFTDKGGRMVALRPELTPTVCRMVAARANALKRPVKWFNVGEFFRYERAQKGRQRSFFQLNADIFGEPGPEAEIELIALLIQCFTAFGLTAQDFRVRLSDRDLWLHYLEALGFGHAQAVELLVAIDKLEKLGDDAFKGYADKHGPLDSTKKQRIKELLSVKSLEALNRLFGPIALPGSPAFSNDERLSRLRRRYFDWQKIFDGLGAMGLADFVQVDLGVVRGLAYYTGFVFEAYDRKGDLRALAGGGRYNDLIKKLGGPDLPAVGFAIGDVTTGILLEQRGLMPAFVNAADLVVAYDGEAGRLAAFPDIQTLRAAGVRVEYSLKELAFGKQLKAAFDSGAKLALLYGADELARGVVKLRDLVSRQEHEVPRAGVVAAVRDAFAGG
ncbi:MAG: histidine--tRNA ligase [Verrucomicrobia bacterium RIFCSPLOWO2_12_FULL_64_8]|nr:MAG: histidine--tRNA ligase [Verrucomicrobia bacterium RIFCSPLOWO2_12_FULL_64_8]